MMKVYVYFDQIKERIVFHSLSALNVLCFSTCLNLLLVLLLCLFTSFFSFLRRFLIPPSSPRPSLRHHRYHDLLLLLHSRMHSLSSPPPLASSSTPSFSTFPSPSPSSSPLFDSRYLSKRRRTFASTLSWSPTFLPLCFLSYSDLVQSPSGLQTPIVFDSSVLSQFRAISLFRLKNPQVLEQNSKLIISSRSPMPKLSFP